jgi:outer membrane protein
MKTTKSIAALAAMMALSVCSDAALAEDSNIFRVGLYSVMYHVGAENISGPFTPPGLSADVDNVQTIYIAYLRRVTSNIEVELTAGVPPSTDVRGKGPNYVGSVPYNGQVLGSVKWLSPSLLVHWVFFDESHRWRPYVGAGVNYTHFYNRETNANGNAVLGGPTAISQTNSVGPAASLGLSYKLQDHWQVIASYNWAWVSSDLSLNTEGIVRKTSVDFRPTAFVFAMGYTF